MIIKLKTQRHWSSAWSYIDKAHNVKVRFKDKQ